MEIKGRFQVKRIFYSQKSDTSYIDLADRDEAGDLQVQQKGITQLVEKQEIDVTMIVKPFVNNNALRLQVTKVTPNKPEKIVQ